MKTIADYDNILVSVSGGRTSAMLAYLIKNDETLKDKNILFAFSDTGKERKETYQFLREVDKAFNLNLVCIKPVVNSVMGVGTGYRIFNIHEEEGGGEQYEDMIKKYGIPNMSRPFCTRELKVVPIQKLCDDYFKVPKRKVAQAVGIRLDELRRVGKGNVKTTKVYPLVTNYRVKLLDVDNFFNDKTKPQLDLKPYEGNCDFCWKKSDKKLQLIHKENPQVIDWWVKMEDTYGTEKGFTFFRNNRSVDDVLNDSINTDFVNDCSCFD